MFEPISALRDMGFAELPYATLVFKMAKVSDLLAAVKCLHLWDAVRVGVFADDDGGSAYHLAVSSSPQLRVVVLAELPLVLKEVAGLLLPVLRGGSRGHDSIVNSCRYCRSCRYFTEIGLGCMISAGD